MTSFGPPDINEMENRRDVKGLISALAYRRDFSVCYKAVRALVRIEALEPLGSAFLDPDGQVRFYAAVGLALTGDYRAAEPLITALKDIKSNQRWRSAAAEALGELGDGRALQPLIAALKDSNPHVRGAAAKALGEIGDRRAWEPLNFAVQHDDDSRVREAAAKALKEIDRPRASFESIRDAPFHWSGSDFVGPNQDWVDKVRRENEAAVSWFDAQGFVRIPNFAGENGAAEYCFDMATQAQHSGNTREAWAGFHQALRRFARLQNDKMLGLTCFNLGKVYGVHQNWEMAEVMFSQSAYLAFKTRDEKGYAWSLVYLSDANDRLGARDIAYSIHVRSAADFRENLSWRRGWSASGSAAADGSASRKPKKQGACCCDAMSRVWQFRVRQFGTLP